MRVQRSEVRAYQLGMSVLRRRKRMVESSWSVSTASMLTVGET